MALPVTISGAETIKQGGRVTLTAEVADVGQFQYTWSANRGSFVGDATGATVVYEADFTDSANVSVMVTCQVTRNANSNPTISEASLTALSELGITGIVVNMFLTELGAVNPNSNNNLYNETNGTLDPNSDDDLTANGEIIRVRWNNIQNVFILNSSGSENLGNFFTGNSTQSVYVVFQDGTYEELTPADFTTAGLAGTTWAGWSVSEAAIRTKLDNLATTDDLTVGVGDTGSVGWTADSGSGTASFTAEVAEPPVIGSIAAVQNFVISTPFSFTVSIQRLDTTQADNDVRVVGLTEGYGYSWDNTAGELTVSGTPTRFVNGKNARIIARNGDGPAEKSFAFNVLQAAPIIGVVTLPDYVRGLPYRAFVPITNIPARVEVESTWLDLIHNKENQGEQEGVLITGVESDKNFTVDDAEAVVNAYWAGGVVTRTFPFDLVDVTFYGGQTIPNGDIHRFRLNGINEDITSLAEASFSNSGTSRQILGMAVDENHIYRVGANGTQRTSRTFSDGDTFTSTQFTTLGFNCVGVDDTTVYTDSGSSVNQIRAHDKSNGSQLRIFNIPNPSSSSSPILRGIVVDDDSLIILELGSFHKLIWVDKNTAHNTEATITKTITLPIIPHASYFDIMIVENLVFLTDIGNAKIYRINKSLSDGTIIDSYDVSYNVPSGMQQMRAISAYLE